MDEEKKGASGILSLPTMLIVLLMTGGLIWQADRLNSPRRVAEGSAAASEEIKQNVEARMWQDPLAAIQHAKIKGKGGTFRPWSLADFGTHVKEQVEASGTQNRAHQGVRVLIVMTPASSYPEDVESRLRMRHAVVSALSQAGYRPQDEEHLGAFRLKAPSKPIQMGTNNFEATSSDLEWNSALEGLEDPLLIPFEWFHLRVLVQTGPLDPDRALVLWVPETFFDNSPLPRLAQLVGALRKNCKGIPKVDFRVLGPCGSTMLRHMIPWWEKGTGTEPGFGQSAPGSLSGVTMYSWSATAMDDHLHRDWQTKLPREKIKNYLKNASGLDFVNVTETDDALCSELVDELKLRGIDLANRNQHAVIISEWDTIYGRTLPLAFAAEVSQRQIATARSKPGRSPVDASAAHALLKDLPQQTSAANNSEEFPHIQAYTYLRGIDGKLPQLAGEETGESKRAAQPNKAKDERKEMQEELNRAEGENQLDYIPRLAWQIKRWEQEIQRGNPALNRAPGTLSAIGVLGSDFYDKLLILQALKAHFPNAVFFTTEMDARFLHPQFLRWTRNLVVSSAFGLSLNPKLQGDIPPFRGSGQSALFLATLAALEQIEAKQFALLPPPARRFEIGRYEAINLSVVADPQKFHPLAERHKPRLRTAALLGVSLFCISVLLIQVLPPFRKAYRPLDRLFEREKALRFRRNAILNPTSIKGKLKGHLGAINGEGGHPPVALPVDRTKEGWAVWLNSMLTRSSTWCPAIPGSFRLRHFTGQELGGARGLQRAYLHVSTMARRRLQLEAWLGDSVRSCRYRSWMVDSRLRWALIGVFLLGALGLGLMLLILKSHTDPSGEPFSLNQGVSGWPCEILRAIAFLLSLVFMFQARSEIRANENMLTEQFALEEHPRKRVWRDWSLVSLWNRHRRKRLLFCLWVRVLWWMHWRYSAISWRWTISDGKVCAKRLWNSYQDHSRVMLRALRACWPMFFYMILCFAVIGLGGVPYEPLRGQLARGFSQVLLYAAVFSLVFFNFLVADAARLARTFIEHLVKLETKWPEKTLEKAKRWTGVTESGDLDEWLDIRFSANLTRPIARLIYYPCIVLSIMLVARTHYFDAWSWPFSLIVVFGLNALWPIYSAFLLQTAASNAREKALESLRHKIGELRYQQAPEARINALERLSQEIRATREGAFTRYLDNPALKALILPFTGAGLANLLDFLTTQ